MCPKNIQTVSLVHVVYPYIRIDTTTAYQAHREKAWREFHKNATSNTEQILEATSHWTAA